jgi:uncharacterized protein YqiB (DUF1249 family)
MRYSGGQVVHPGVRARDLPALMELYELNYIQLRRLVPDLDAIQDHSVSRVNGAIDLHLRVRERTRYTTTMNLSYQFAEGDDLCFAPDVVVRMYHDAQLAEVISHSRRQDRREASYDGFRSRYTVEAKWRVNRFLHKWLGYCLQQGHGFPPARDRRTEALQAPDSEKALSLES